MITLPNFLSFLRIPLAFFFLLSSPVWRVFAIFTAACTDFFDGYLARQFRMKSRLGTILDPISDKFFVAMALGIFLYEGKMTPLEACAMLGRDFAVLVFGLYLLLAGHWGRYRIRAIVCGKLVTTFQFLVLLVLAAGYEVPHWSYGVFVLLGVASLCELWASKNAVVAEPDTE